MLNEKIEKSLREHAPVPPAGFAERSDAQVLRLMSEGKKKHALSGKTILVFALVLVMGITTALAASVEDVNTLLYKFWPQAAEFLMPLDVTCVDRGIEIKVLSASVGERDALVTFSLQDLEGSRVNEYTRLEIHPEQLFAGYTETESGVLQLSFDPETKTAVYAQTVKTNGISLPADASPTLTVDSLYTPEHVLVNLVPLMEENAERTDTVSLTESAIPMALETYSGSFPESMKILDPAGSLGLPEQREGLLLQFGPLGHLHADVHAVIIRFVGAILCVGIVIQSVKSQDNVRHRHVVGILVGQRDGGAVESATNPLHQRGIALNGCNEDAIRSEAHLFGVMFVNTLLPIPLPLGSGGWVNLCCYIGVTRHQGTNPRSRESAREFRWWWALPLPT